MAYIKRALETEAATIGEVSEGAQTNKYCTKARAIRLGCNVEGSYSKNQLIANDDLSLSQEITAITTQNIFIITRSENPKYQIEWATENAAYSGVYGDTGTILYHGEKANTFGITDLNKPNFWNGTRDGKYYDIAAYNYHYYPTSFRIRDNQPGIDNSDNVGIGWTAYLDAMLYSPNTLWAKGDTTNFLIDIYFNSNDITDFDNVYLFLFGDNHFALKLNYKDYIDGRYNSGSNPAPTYSKEHWMFNVMHWFKIKKSDIINGINKFTFEGTNVGGRAGLCYFALEGTYENIKNQLINRQIEFYNGSDGIYSSSGEGVKILFSANKDIGETMAYQASCNIGDYNQELGKCIQTYESENIPVNTETRIQSNISLVLKDHTSNVYIDYYIDGVKKVSNRQYDSGTHFETIITFTTTGNKEIKYVCKDTDKSTVLKTFIDYVLVV